MGKHHPAEQSQMQEVRITPPWVARFPRNSKHIQCMSFADKGYNEGDKQASIESLNNFVAVRTGLHSQYITQLEKTKRISIITCAALIGLSILLPVFAPDGRETVSYLGAAALVVLAAGVAGFSTLSIRALRSRLELSRTEKLEN